MPRRCRPLLGTYVEIAVPSDFAALIEPAFLAIAHVHARMSFHEETSDLALLRRVSTGEIVTLDPETIAVLQIAKDLHFRPNGLFDVAIGGDLVAMGFLPRPQDVRLDRMTGTTRDIAIVDSSRAACLAPMLIDLGGIAKGYAVDRAIELLADAGVPRAVVNAGGDLRVHGEVSEPIHLREVDGSIIGAIEITNAAVASSGQRVDHRLEGGRMLTPHLGAGREPIMAERAVTVVAPRCVIADAMTKVALANPVLAAAMLDELGGAIVARPASDLAA